MTDSDTDLIHPRRRGHGIVDHTANTITDPWTYRTMADIVERALANVAPGRSVRWDVASLASHADIMPVCVPALRLALVAYARAGRITLEPARGERDASFVFTNSAPATVDPMTEQFEEDFEEDMDFGAALVAMKNGRRVARRAWMADGKWVALRTGYPYGIEVNANTAEAFGVPPGTLVRFQPYFQMCERDGSVRTWNKGDQDLIGEDWYVVDGPGNLAVDPAQVVPAATVRTALAALADDDAVEIRPDGSKWLRMSGPDEI